MEHQNLEHESSQTNNSQTKNSSFTIPFAILAAGVLIAAAVVYSSGNNAGSVRGVDGDSIAGKNGPSAIDNISPITDEDHILGNPSATVIVVEFSDTECPFCKRFHFTMQELMDEYGKSGQVAWVFRHFPLVQLHSKAPKEAEATECANELGGNTKFWAYLDRIFEITPSNDGLALSELSNIAEFVGLDRTEFEQCLNSGKYAQHVADDLADAMNSGGNGTPYSVVIAPNGKKFPISGAQPYASVKSIVEIALQEK